MKLPLAYYGNPILRKKALQVKEITAEIRQLVSDMIETMDAEKGIGIAAPQVHQSLAIFITRAPVKQEDDTWVDGPLVRVYINPKIVGYSSELEADSEGCLSIPKLHGEVVRPLKISLQATDLEGNTFVEDHQDLNARIIMHENDHLNGVLFIDRMHGKERKELESKLQKIKQQFKNKN